MKFNLEQEEAWTPNTGSMLGVGEYIGVIAESEANLSSGQHPQIEVKLVDVAQQGDIKDWIVITPNTVGKVKQFLEAVGVGMPEGDVDTDSPEWAKYIAALASKRVGFVVRLEDDLKKQREGQAGAKRPRVTAYVRPEQIAELKKSSGGTPAAAAPATGLAGAFGGGDPGSSAPPRGDDDIPF